MAELSPEDIAKAAAREAATKRRAGLAAQARASGAEARAQTALARALEDFGTGPIAGYVAMRSEIDPGPALAVLAGLGRALCLPVVPGKAVPLVFHGWAPGEALIEGAFGARVPAGGAAMVPTVLVIPLLAFDAAGFRLGYGGGYYDRTLEVLRAANPSTIALGFAFAGQEVDAVPRDAHDARLDAVVTEAGLRHFSPA